MGLTMRERTFRPALMAAVLSDPRPGVVLDLGCGTGTFAGQLAEAGPSVQVLSPRLLMEELRLLTTLDRNVPVDTRPIGRVGH